MYSIILLYRANYSDEYISADSLFDGRYNIYELLEKFPDAYLLLINDKTQYNIERVINRDRLNSFFKVSTDNEIPCVNCGAMNPVDSEYCYKCGYKNKYYSVTKYLSNDFEKSMKTREYVLFEFWRDMSHRDVG